MEAAAVHTNPRVAPDLLLQHFLALGETPLRASARTRVEDAIGPDLARLLISCLSTARRN